MKLRNKNLFTLGIALVIIASSVLSCSLAPEKIEIYVSTLGSDDNNGSKNSPFRSLQKAVDVGNRNNLTINVAKGVYTPNDGLNSKTNGVEIFSVTNFNLLGGWDNNFSSRSGYSELDGKSNLYHIINLNTVKNVVIDGFVIRGGNANGAFPYSGGGGIDTTYFYDSTIMSCIISNNISIGNGGGICLYGNNNTINSSIYNNTANQGGGIYLYGDNNTISGSVQKNIAKWVGGGIYLYSADNNTISSSIHDNISDNNSGGIGLWMANNNTITGSIYSNTADNKGGGIKLSEANNNTFSGSVYDNTSDNSGGGFYLYEANYNTINCSVYNNNAILSSGGGIYLYEANYNIISGSLHNNSAGYNGGGIYLSSDSNTFSGSIFSNIASRVIGSDDKGGGVYLWSSAINNVFTATCVIKWNTVSGGSVGDGGGVYNAGAAGSQTTNPGFTISDNSPDDWAGGEPSAP